MILSELAQAFVNKKAAKCGNAHTDGHIYFLHGNAIASHTGDGRVAFNWCKYYTATTASHLNGIQAALQIPAQRFSYALARDGKTLPVGFF